MFNKASYIINNTTNDTILIDSISLVSELQYRIATRNTTTESEQLVSEYLDLSDTVSNVSAQILNSSQSNSNSSNKLTSGIEIIVNKVNQTNYTKNLTNFKVFSNIILNDQSSYGITTTNGGIYYNPFIINNLLETGQNPRLTFIIYSNTKFFQVDNIQEVNNSKIQCSSNGNSKQISSNVLAVKSINGLMMTSPSDLISTVHAPNLVEQNCLNKNLNFDCVYWDYEANNWNNFGCVHSYLEQNDSTLYHYCSCNHTTSFSLLMTLDDYKYCSWCESTLSYLSLISIIFSLIGLGITILYDLCM